MSRINRPVFYRQSRKSERPLSVKEPRDHLESRVLDTNPEGSTLQAGPSEDRSFRPASGVVLSASGAKHGEHVQS